MPLEYSIDPDANMIRMRCVGDFTFEELVAHTERVNADDRFRPGMNTLGDYREARLVGDISQMHDYLEHSERLYEARGRCKWAIMVADESFKNLVMMFDLVAKQRGVGIETRAFKEESEAEEWLHQKESPDA
jgi:hypothetical protein